MAKQPAKMTQSTEAVQRHVAKMQRHAANYGMGAERLTAMAVQGTDTGTTRKYAKGQHPRSLMARKRNGHVGRVYWSTGSIKQLTEELMCVVSRADYRTRENKVLYAKLQEVNANARAMHRQLLDIVDTFYRANHNIPKE